MACRSGSLCWPGFVFCCIALAACIAHGSHPYDFFEVATLELVSIKSLTMKKNRDQQLFSAYVHPQHAHLKGFCYEVHNEEAAVRIQGVVAVQGTIPADTAASVQPNQTFSTPSFHVILPRMSRYELVTVSVEEAITAQLPIMFRSVSCKSAADALKPALSPGHAAGGGKCPSANKSEELPTGESTNKFPRDEAAFDAVAFLSAVYTNTASERQKSGRVVAGLHQLAIFEEVGTTTKSVEMPQAHRSLGTLEGNPPELGLDDLASNSSLPTEKEGQSNPAAIFARDFLLPGWKDVATMHARPLHENGVDGEGRAYCKYLPEGTQISVTWQPDDKSAGSPFVGKKTLEFWLRVRSVEDPEPLKIILSGKDGDCKHISTSELQPTETLRNWARYAIDLSKFDARQQTQEGDTLVHSTGGMLAQCSDKLDVLDIRTITWALPSSLMGSTVCLDDVKLV